MRKKICLILSLITSVIWGYLTPEQVTFYHENGYLVLDHFFCPCHGKQLQNEMGKLVSQLTPDQVGSFDSDPFFLASAQNISFFYEPNAFDSNGKLTRPLSQSLNKAGHVLHALNPIFKKFSDNQSLTEISYDLGLADPWIVQSMYIFKQPFIGGEVTCHQDGTFLYTEPQNGLGFWFAIDDASIENGCLHVIPGGHQTAIKKRFVVQNGATDYIIDDETPWDLRRLVPLEAKKGTMIILHARLPHMSFCNKSSKSRHAYTLHLIDATSYYPSENWLIPLQ